MIVEKCAQALRQLIRYLIGSTDADLSSSGCTLLGQTVSIPHRPGLKAKLDLDPRFSDEGAIADGGMSVIHRVLERSLDRRVAMKVMHDELRAHSSFRQRFINEARITGRLEHPNIVPVYELGHDGPGALYFTMKLIQGETLGDFYKKLKGERPRDALYATLQVFLKVCDALAYAHSRDVIHCDVKPDNIMVGEHGQVYLMDWGIAYQLDQSDMPSEVKVIGTYAYMSPEQASGQLDRLDRRTDIFCLGGVLYYLLTGVAPYQGKDKQALITQAKRCEIVPPDQRVEPTPPRPLTEIALKALKRDPAQRYQSVQQLRDEVEGVLRGRWRFPTLKLRAGSSVIEAGDPGEEAFIIRSGHCEVYQMDGDHKIILRILGPGDVFGEAAILANQPRSASVRAIDDIELSVVEGRTLLEELGVESTLGSFLRNLAQRFTEHSDDVTHLLGELAREKIRKNTLSLLLHEGCRSGERYELSWSYLLAHLQQRFDYSESELQRILLEEPGLTLELGEPSLLCGRFGPEAFAAESERLKQRVGQLEEQAEWVLGGRERAKRWFREPQPALGQQSPLSLLDSDAGVNHVETLLKRIEQGSVYRAP